MKKILLLLIILVSCEKADNGIAGSTWFAEGESSGSSTEYVNGEYITSEYSSVNETTLRFINDTRGSVTVVSTPTVDGVRGETKTKTTAFTYTYDPGYMRGDITYESYMDEAETRPLVSSFEIRSGFLYDDSELTGRQEFRRE